MAPLSSSSSVIVTVVVVDLEYLRHLLLLLLPSALEPLVVQRVHVDVSPVLAGAALKKEGGKKAGNENEDLLLA